MKELLRKHRDLIPYAVFGVLTTIVNIAVYWLTAHVLRMDTVPASVVSWAAAVLFAYITNRTWVFHSTARGWRRILPEMAGFFLARLATGVLDWAVMYVTVDRLGWNDVGMKAAANVIVIILNYVFSRWIVFRKRAVSPGEGER